MRTKLVKISKAFTLIIAVTIISLLCLAPLRAQEAGASSKNNSNYLYNIMINTAGILKKVNNLPEMLGTLTKSAISWMTPDDTDTTASLQQTFTNLANFFLTENSSQLSLQPRLLSDLFNNAGPTDLPYANDLTYTTLLGAPYFTKDPRNKEKQKAVDPSFNYLKNASGFGINHTLPGVGGFSGTPADQLRYINLYITTTAVESFNAYILSSLYADQQSGGGYSEVQRALITQSSSADWFSHVSSEKLGVVFRQILMYQSQTFMLLTQMIKLQKQQLEAQVMNNTMLMAVNIANEQNILQRAVSKTP